ncbi:hypothetical protein BD779DRAFT_1466442 [Infundibulicybe gibba]|nr:hypothetical protein BD779DRAFT_1466442 [Infundibulicybe gibba]
MSRREHGRMPSIPPGEVDLFPCPCSLSRGVPAICHLEVEDSIRHPANRSRLRPRQHADIPHQGTIMSSPEGQGTTQALVPTPEETSGVHDTFILVAMHRTPCRGGSMAVCPLFRRVRSIHSRAHDCCLRGMLDGNGITSSLVGSLERTASGAESSQVCGAVGNQDLHGHYK